MKASINGVTTTGFTVDITTGIVTFNALKTKNITGITKVSQAVVTVGSHTFIPGDIVYLSGILGMVQMNGLYATVLSVTSTKITIDVDSTLFTTYTSGGSAKILPLVADVVKGGFEFDIPCRFNSRIDYSHITPNMRDTSTIDLVELVTL